MLHLMGVDEEAVRKGRPFWFDPANTSLTQWHRDDRTGHWTLDRYNDAAHLEGLEPYSARPGSAEAGVAVAGVVEVAAALLEGGAEDDEERAGGGEHRPARELGGHRGELAEPEHGDHDDADVDRRPAAGDRTGGEHDRASSQAGQRPDEARVAEGEDHGRGEGRRPGRGRG